MEVESVMREMQINEQTLFNHLNCYLYSDKYRIQPSLWLFCSIKTCYHAMVHVVVDDLGMWKS